MLDIQARTAVEQLTQDYMVMLRGKPAVDETSQAARTLFESHASVQRAWVVDAEL